MFYAVYSLHKNIKQNIIYIYIYLCIHSDNNSTSMGCESSINHISAHINCYFLLKFYYGVTIIQPVLAGYITINI